MGCVEALNYEIVLRDASLRSAGNISRVIFPNRSMSNRVSRSSMSTLSVCRQSQSVLDGDFVIFPYTKPCHGTFLLRVEDAQEAARLRSLKKAGR